MDSINSYIVEFKSLGDMNNITTTKAPIIYLLEDELMQESILRDIEDLKDRANRIVYVQEPEESELKEPKEEPKNKESKPVELPTKKVGTPDPPIAGTRYNRGKLRAEILDLLEKELGWKHDKEFHLGEAIRPKNAGYGVKNSNHCFGNAVDLTPRGEMTFEGMKKAFLGNANIRKFFAENQIGILDESTAAIRAKNPWKSTRNHYHIGPDGSAVRTWGKWLKAANYAKKGGILKAQNGINIVQFIPIEAELPLQFTPVLNNSAHSSKWNMLRKVVDNLKLLSYGTVVILTPASKKELPKLETKQEAKLGDIKSQPFVEKGEYVEKDGIKISKDFLDFKHIMECGTPFGQVSERHLKGIDVKDFHGHKTYGPGLLYDPDTHRLMDETTAKRGGKPWTVQELDDKFLKHIANKHKKVIELFGNGLNPDLVSALASISGLFGHVPEKLATAVKSGDPEKIKHAWLHAHDSDPKYGKFKSGWDKRSMFEWMWFNGIHTKGFNSPEVRKATKEYYGSVV